MGDPCMIVFASLQCHCLVAQSCSVVLLHLFEDLRCVGSRLCGAAVWTWTAGLQEDDLLSAKCRFEELQILQFGDPRLKDFLLPIFDATGDTVAKASGRTLEESYEFALLDQQVAGTGERVAMLKEWLADLCRPQKEIWKY